MNLDNVTFKRRFSVNFYRNLSIPMSEMSFHKDWINTNCGDPYPVLQLDGKVSESIENGEYSLTSQSGGKICRLLGSFFPYATYDLEVKDFSNSSYGFHFFNEDGFSLEISANKDNVNLKYKDKDLRFTPFSGGILSVTFRSGGVSIYSENDSTDTLIADVDIEELKDLTTAESFRNIRIGVIALLSENGSVKIKSASSRITAGISQADIKPIKYENGEVMLDNGRVYLTVSARQQVGCYQVILSWRPTTSDFRMESAIFYDCGDGKWSNDVALSLIFDRNTKKWIYWMCAFSHNHILGRGSTEYDPRFGINLLKVDLADNENDGFCSVQGDEDPDIIFYDGKWHLSVCRFETDGKYHYQHFVSDNPFGNFKYFDHTLTGDKTGGMFVKSADKLYFICGTDFNNRAKYDVYLWNDFSSCFQLKADFDDGGFRGWGSVMEIPAGSEKRLIWITFDRHNGSNWNWSYGNIYVFDGEEN